MFIFKIVLLLFLPVHVFRFSGRDRLVSELTGFEYLGVMGVYFGLVAFLLIFTFPNCFSFTSFRVLFEDCDAEWACVYI